jgi:DNA-binding GntR family transcriptional regulator
MLDISRNTALAAYDELIADGLLVSQRGSGTRIAESKESLERTTSFRPARWSWAQLLRESQFPTRTVSFSDPDGNALYLFETAPAQR